METENLRLKRNRLSFVRSESSRKTSKKFKMAVRWRQIENVSVDDEFADWAHRFFAAAHAQVVFTASFHRKVEVARTRFLKYQEQHFRLHIEIFANMTGAEIDFKSITIVEIALVVNANTLLCKGENRKVLCYSFPFACRENSWNFGFRLNLFRSICYNTEANRNLVKLKPVGY